MKSYPMEGSFFIKLPVIIALEAGKIIYVAMKQEARRVLK